MTVTLNPTPSFGGHTFPDFMGPVYFEEDGGLGDGPAPVTDPVVTPAEADPAPVDPPVSTDPAPEPAPDPAPADIPDPDDGTIPEPLKPYVTKLREEAAERRVALKPFEEAFAPYDDAGRETLLNLVTSLASEETQHEAAQAMVELAKTILGDDLSGAESDPNRPLTRADLDRIEATKQAKASEEAAVQAVVKEATDLGYEENSTPYRRLMDLAVNETGGDLAKAHEAIQAERDQIIADYAKQVQEGKAKWPTLAPQVGATPADVSGEAPKTWAEARHNAQARAAAARG